MQDCDSGVLSNISLCLFPTFVALKHGKYNVDRQSSEKIIYYLLIVMLDCIYGHAPLVIDWT